MYIQKIGWIQKYNLGYHTFGATKKLACKTFYNHTETYWIHWDNRHVISFIPCENENKNSNFLNIFKF